MRAAGSLQALHDLVERRPAGTETRLVEPDDRFGAQTGELEEILLRRVDVDQSRQEFLLLLRLLAKGQRLRLVRRVVVRAEFLEADMRAVVQLDVLRRAR